MYFKRYLILVLILGNIFMYALEIVPLRKNPNLSEVLYINCLQVTQLQQLLKNYLLSGMRLQYKSPQKTLYEAIDKYDKRLYQIGNFFKDTLEKKHQREEIDSMFAHWEKAKSILKDTPIKSKVDSLKRHLDKIADTLKKPHNIFGKHSFEAIAATGELCRVPFYIANLYFMRTWGVAITDYIEKMKMYRKNYVKGIHVLERHNENTKNTTVLIRKAKKAFFLMNEYIRNSKKYYVPALISKKSDRNFQYILKIKNEYNKMKD